MASRGTVGRRRKRLCSRAHIEQKAEGIKLTKTQLEAARQWARLLDGNALRREESNYANFQQYIMQDLLGYENVEHEYAGIDFVVPGKGDGGHMLVVECKGSGQGLDERQYRKNMAHSTAMGQLWDYMRHGEWGIVTNYVQFRLVNRSKGDGYAHEVDFRTLYDGDDLDTDRVAGFVYAFGELVRSGGDALDADADTEMEDMEMTNRFYRLFSDTRLMLVREFEADGADRNDAIREAQIFLNRLIFLFFVEDRGMVKNGLFMSHLRGNLTHGFPGEGTDVICRGIRDDLFRALNGGHQTSDIPEFNGGLFREDTALDASFRDCRNITWFEDAVPNPAPVSTHSAKKLARGSPPLSPIILNVVEMRQYSFRSDIDLNILGHVFEQSIQDLDAMAAGSVRKSEGIYYTPQYITDWICRNAILPYLALSGTAQEPEDIVREYAERRRLPELEKRLRDLRVLDPACGSGAFITAAAAVLLEVHEAIHDLHVLNRDYLSTSGQARLDKWNADAVMRRIITDNIYGVDKNPQAVRISQLSLFLLVASSEDPLPDASGHIIPGNSIICDHTLAPDAVRWAETFPEAFASDNPGFDIIVGNPPYGAKLDVGERSHLKKSFDIGGTNTAAVFIHQSLRLLKRGGMHGFIVPKSLMFSSREWIKTREALLPDLACLVDVGKAWREVKLEQCVYVARKGSGTARYAAGMRAGDDIRVTASVDKGLVRLFGTFPSLASEEEARLGRKIIQTSCLLGEYVTNKRGASLSRYRTNRGIPVVGGKQVQQYHLNGVKFYVRGVNDEKARVTRRSVLVQRLVAHITKPADHIRITATVPPNTDLVIDETVNHLTVAESVSPYYVLGLLHSKVINWYVYRFVFSKGIRSIQFDPPTTNKIPITVSREDEVVSVVKAILSCHGSVGGGGAGRHARIQKLTGELDRLFYAIFGLTAGEVRIVEESFGGGPNRA